MEKGNIENFENNQEIEEKKKIEIIEKASISADDKLSLALLLLGRKDVSFLGNAEIIRKEGDELKIIEKFKKELEESKKILDEAGFSYRASDIKLEDEIASFSIEVAKNNNKLLELTRACEKGDDKKIGELLGFPKTAVETYDTDEALDFEIFFKEELSETEREELAKSGILNFVGFQPSREHWKEEFIEVKKDQEIIKERAPKLYSEIVKINKY